MIRSGLSLSVALKTLSDQISNQKFRIALQNIQADVEKGVNFGDALKKYPNIFSELYVHMVQAGEVSGNLEEVLKQINIQMKRDYNLVSKVKGAMIYPAIVVTAMIGIGIGMVIFVIPKFIGIFEEVQAELPLPTKILISVSRFITNNGLIIGLITLVALVILVKFLRTTRGHRLLHLFFLKAPVLGTIVKKVNLARFSRMLSSMMKTDIPIVDSMNITGRTLGNYFYKKAMIEAGEKIKKGVSINKALREYPLLFSPLIIQMITVGESTGSIDNILSELAEFYEEDVDQTMRNLPSIIEPILMLILGAGVAGMALAVLMPMYSLTQSI